MSDNCNTKYKHWDILDEIPEGWNIDKTAGSPAPNTVFITNGKSLFDGQKRALLKVKAKQIEYAPIIKTEKAEPIERKEEYFIFPAKTVNDLARKKFQEQILKEIMFDLMVCEIEGWDKLEYISELKTLINSIDTNK